MFSFIQDPANLEIWSVTHFYTQDIRPVDIHQHICEMYGENGINDGMMRKWVRQFNGGKCACNEGDVFKSNVW